MSDLRLSGMLNVKCRHPMKPTMKVLLRIFNSIQRKQKSDHPKHQHKDSSHYSSTKMSHSLLSASECAHSVLKQLNCCFVGKNPNKPCCYLMPHKFSVNKVSLQVGDTER